MAVDTKFFRKKTSFNLEEIQKITGASLSNAVDFNLHVDGVSNIKDASETDIVCLNNSKYKESLLDSKSKACFISEKFLDYASSDMACFVTDNPYYAFAILANELYEDNIDNNCKLSLDSKTGAYIAENAQIGDNVTIESGVTIRPNVKIGDNCFIGASSYIADNVEIGNNCTIKQNVTISNSIISNNVIIHSGVKIGQDGFGFATHNGKHIKVPQLGRVLIADNVDIGSNSCIDRGSNTDTIIGTGVMIDNLVQIGHNVQIGKGCIIVSQVGISGSTILEDYVVVGGQVGIAGHLKIGSGAMIAAKSGIAQDVAPMAKIGGIPGVPILQWHKQNSMLKKIVKNKS